MLRLVSCQFDQLLVTSRQLSRWGPSGHGWPWPRSGRNFPASFRGPRWGGTPTPGASEAGRAGAGLSQPPVGSRSSAWKKVSEKRAFGGGSDQPAAAAGRPRRVRPSRPVSSAPRGRWAEAGRVQRLPGSSQSEVGRGGSVDTFFNKCS